MIKGALLITAMLVLSACGMTKRGTIPWENKAKPTTAPTRRAPESPGKNSVKKDLSADEQQTQEFLQLAYNDWKGVPYVLGGSGYKGIDCSAFMQVVFEDYFTTIIPRTTKKQMVIGDKVRLSDIKTGDLVFFKTGRKTYHVGVMINEEEFLHASTTNGVKISELSDKYWNSRYLTARRIL
jgi:cell wall-associated NlpC family hydrolase